MKYIPDDFFQELAMILMASWVQYFLYKCLGG